MPPSSSASADVSATAFVSAPGEWDPETDNWVDWARAPGFDAYWYYREAFFDAVLPPPAGRTLEVGCGEGRVARDLVARGHRVTALDSAAGLVRHARRADASGSYLVADSSRLPIDSGSFDLVVGTTRCRSSPTCGRRSRSVRACCTKAGVCASAWRIPSRIWVTGSTTRTHRG